MTSKPIIITTDFKKAKEAAVFNTKIFLELSRLGSDKFEELALVGEQLVVVQKPELYYD